MFSYANPHGNAGNAMMARSSTKGNKQDESKSYKEKRGGVENGIRVGKNGGKAQAAWNISHGTAVTFLFFFMLVVTVFTQIGWPSNQLELQTQDYTEIGKFHVGNEWEHGEAPHAAQTAEFGITEIFIEDNPRQNVSLIFQVTKNKITGSFGNEPQIEEIHHGTQSQRGQYIEDADANGCQRHDSRTARHSKF